MKKKFLFLIFLLFVLFPVRANFQGHFFLNLENENIPVTNIVEVLSSKYKLPSNSSFVEFRDETDNLGIRHISYQYYIGGVEVEHAIVLVHAKNGIVYAVNGDIMGSTSNLQLKKRISPLEAVKRARQNAQEKDVKLKIIRIFTTDGKEILRYAYEVLADDNTSKSYIDAETGEIIKNVSLIFNIDVAGTVTTMYNGTQAITCYEEDGKFYLMDEARGIITLNATNNPYSINYSTDDGETELMNLVKNSSRISNSSTTWTSTWDFHLSSITIDKIIQNSTWYVIGEGEADVYIKIRNEAGTLLYTSNYLTNPDLPISFNVSSLNLSLSSMPYTVELWDYDPIGDDDIIDIFTIDVTAGDKTAIPWIGSGNYSEGTFTSIGKGFLPHFDAHWGMEKTFDFYKEKFNRNSFDNKGAIIYNLVNPPTDELMLSDIFLNAKASLISPFPMIYGTGLLSSNPKYAEISIRPIVSVDVMAHEFTHLITAHNGNGGLENIGESGALNESFSDIMGIAVKNYATKSNDWLIGSRLLTNISNIRSMKNPNNSFDGKNGKISSPQPDTYQDNLYWINPLDTQNDKGGVHTNSGVQNFWFYLLSEGGDGTNNHNVVYNVTGIGMDKALQIAYRNLIYYLTPEATFEDARNGSIQAAVDLYGKDSNEKQSVIEAWNAVGVYEPHEITIKAKMPSDWGSTISAWVWEDGSEGSWATLTKEGEWYSYTSTANPLNIVFVNGSTWNGDNNQSVDIKLTESVCILLNSNTGKRTYTYIDCPAEAERYVVLAQRNTSSNWFYMTSDLGTANTKRYQAVDAGTAKLENVITSDLDNKYYWQIEEDPKGDKLRTTAGYSAWTSGNSADLGATGKDLTITKNADGTYTFSFADGDRTRRLALNQDTRNNYFAYYVGESHAYKLTLLKEGESAMPTSIEITPSNGQDSKVTKILRNGQILILRGDKTYTVIGHEVR